MKLAKLVSTAFSLLFLFSCSKGGSVSSPSAQTPVEVTDGLGRKDDYVPGSYKRIVCVGAGALRAYSYLGDVSLLAGVEDIDSPDRRTATSPFEGVGRPYYDAKKESFRGLESAGKGGPLAMKAGIPLTELLSLKPDLIVSAYSDAADANKMAEATGAKVYSLSFGPKGPFDPKLYDSYLGLGEVLGRSSRAKELVDYLKASKEELEGKAKEAEKAGPVQAYVAGIGNWGQTDYLSTHITFPPFEVAGVSNVASDASMVQGQGQTALTKEAFLALGEKMEKLYLDAAGLKKTLLEYQQDETILDAVKAVQDGEVYLLLPYNAYYTNIEVALIDSYYIASTAYPSLYEGFSFEEKEKEIYETFLGKDMTKEEASLKGNYGGFQQIQDLKSFLKEQEA